MRRMSNGGFGDQGGGPPPGWQQQQQQQQGWGQQPQQQQQPFGAPQQQPFGAPQGYGPPPGYGQQQQWGGHGQFGVAPGMGQMPLALAPGQVLRPEAAQVLTERNAGLVVVLTIVTLGIYWMIWMYKTSDELRTATGDESIKPGLDLLLTCVTCGIWGIYVEYRNAKKVYDVFRALNRPHEDKSGIVIICAFFFRIAAPFLVQEELNALGKLARGQPA